MKKRSVIIGLLLLVVVAIWVTLQPTASSSVAARPVRLVITGPDGQQFSGTYIADGVTNSVRAIAPATIGLQAREVAYEFKREGGDGEFRVALYVGDLPRLSTTCGQRQGVRGQLRYSSDNESYWAAGF
jgi:hypothetical protein